MCAPLICQCAGGYGAPHMSHPSEASIRLNDHPHAAACRSSKREPHSQGPRKRGSKYGMRRVAWGGNSMRQWHFENTRDLSRTRFYVVELSALINGPRDVSARVGVGESRIRSMVKRPTLRVASCDAPARWVR